MPLSRRKMTHVAGLSAVAITAGVAGAVTTASPAAGEIDTFEFMSVNFPNWFLSWPPLRPGEPERVALESTNVLTVTSGTCSDAGALGGGCGRCEAQPMRSASETMIPSGPRT